jgi:hypothetical protein
MREEGISTTASAASEVVGIVTSLIEGPRNNRANGTGSETKVDSMEVWEKGCVRMVQTKFSQSLHVCVVPDDPGIKSVPSQHTNPGLVVVESCPIRVHRRLAEHYGGC